MIPQRHLGFGKRSDAVSPVVSYPTVAAAVSQVAPTTAAPQDVTPPPGLPSAPARPAADFRSPVATKEAMRERGEVDPSLAERVTAMVLDRIDVSVAAQLSREEVAEALGSIVGDALSDLRATLNRPEQERLTKQILDELVGYGPLEGLLSDPTVSDILVNGPNQVYVERNGRLELTSVTFRDSDHVFQVAQRICSNVGRRVDQSSPLADARLADGSRVNVVGRPLALRGPAISIRKFSDRGFTLASLAAEGACSPAMAKALRIAAACRLNIIVSGGTGSGKTTLLNALSREISPDERLITIEDAAELKLQQPHVVTLETRPVNVEGSGQITIRDLVINALRMRPDRIILGEVRGPEAFDLLAAMNTGHDGSMCTMHANSPREAVMRLENMIMMSSLKISRDAILRQMVESIDLIVQVKRLRDGSRRITSITEVTGTEGKTVLSHELFRFEYLREGADGRIIGEHRSTGLMPTFLEKLRHFEQSDAFLEACR